MIHFFHGNGFSGQTYAPMLSELGEYNLFLNHAQGHGGSDPGGRFLGWNQTAQTALHAVESQQAHWPQQPCIGVAHSFGTVITLLMAAQQPSLFRGLLLLDPIFYPPPLLWSMRLAERTGLLKRAPLVTQALKRRQAWPDKDSAWAYFHQRGVFKGWDDRALASYLHDALYQRPSGVLQLKCPAYIEASIFGSYASGLWSAIRQLKIPVWIAYGSRTYPFVAPAAKQAAKCNPNIQTHVFQGGHCFMQEQPQQVGQWLRTQISVLLNS